VNPAMDDIMADFKVDSSMAPATSSGSKYSTPTKTEPSHEAIQKTPGEFLPRAKPTAPGSSAESFTHTYVVKPGDTLSSISKEFYGNARDYRRIFNANSSQLTNPNTLEVGQKLEIPMK